MEKLQLNRDSIRKEIKFLFPIQLLTNYKNLIEQLGWKEEFPIRKVHSIYFDTLENDLLYDSIHGLGKREKIRLRYYNEFNDVHFERKIKKDIYSFKILMPKPNIISFSNKNLCKIANEVTDWVGHKVFPVSQVHYNRNYYKNSINNIRITFDTNIETKDLINNVQRDLINLSVCEVKSGINQTINLPFNLMPTRFSKYSFSRVGNNPD
jgi:hypothetical protein